MVLVQIYFIVWYMAWYGMVPYGGTTLYHLHTRYDVKSSSIHEGYRVRYDYLPSMVSYDSMTTLL